MRISIRLHEVPKGERVLSRSEDAFAHSGLLARPFAIVVADGHGDPPVNAMTCMLAASVARQFCDDVASSEQELCARIQIDVAQRFSKERNGAVATRAVFETDCLTVANVGDCRLYRFAPKQYIRIRTTHGRSSSGSFARVCTTCAALA